ncbi:hypothetical protein [Salimicrobium humidisoli]|uniref:hypothetical protein n=1 Tax=Salimicrobium humidisoli TaxID=2029857 RepID=UPI00130422B8|nr:hypothetical protein [Salimicrobium humidisoli]
MENSNRRKARVVELLKVVVTEGDGNEAPLKEVTQYWSKEGEVLFKKASGYQFGNLIR